MGESPEDKGRREQERGMVLLSVATSPWVRAADDRTTVSQCPLKDGQAGPCFQSAKTPGLATISPKALASPSTLEARDTTNHSSTEQLSQYVTTAAPCSPPHTGKSHYYRAVADGQSHLFVPKELCCGVRSGEGNRVSSGHKTYVMLWASGLAHSLATQ